MCLVQLVSVAKHFLPLLKSADCGWYFAAQCLDAVRVTFGKNEYALLGYQPIVETVCIITWFSLIFFILLVSEMK